MDIPTLMQYRYHFAVAVWVSALVSGTLYAAPRLGSIVAYFWPLFASTGLFIAAIIAFSGISQLAVEAHAGGEDHKAGEDIIEYVAGDRDEHVADEREHRDHSFE